VAVDVPSGVDCDTGAVDANTFAANLTITFGAAKVGQYCFPAADYLGELIVAPLGWPESLPTLATVQLELADQSRVQAALPKRSRDSHKYNFGRLLVVAGSRNYVGAAYLVGAAATRSGVGLVTMAVPESVQSLLAAHLIESTWLPLPESNGFIAESAVEKVTGSLNKANAVVVGPGLGMEETTKNFVCRLVGAIRESPLPTLVDADGLRLLAQIENWPDLLPKPTLLTPHLGEMQALTGLDKDEIQKDRLGVAKRFARQWGQIVLLKGAFTVIAAPDGRAVIEPFATPALAKAGSGDVLSGIIGSLLAQGVEPFEAAVAGAFIHGRAGELAAKELGTTVSVTARDYVAMLAKVFKDLAGF
jgi:NAD(P)H-hydrate epimerase